MSIEDMEGKMIVIKDYTYNPTPRATFPTSRIGRIISEEFKSNREKYYNIIDAIVSFKNFFEKITIDNPKSMHDPYWKNGWVPPIDGVMIYTVIATNNPRYYVECGSGNTTKFAAKAIADHNLKTKIISIDPQPRSEIASLCYKNFRVPLENMDLEFISKLSSEDIFIMDGSHRAFTNSDTTVFFTEILPELPSDMIYAIHDIALPNEIYSERFYNEQYMLSTYIVAGMMGDSIYFPTGYLSTHTTILSELENKLSIHPEIKFRNWDGFFWLKRGHAITGT